MTHDLLYVSVCLNLVLYPSLWRAERQLDVVGWLFGHIEVWALVYFFSPQESLLGQQSTESVEPRLERFGLCSGLMVVCAC